MSSDINWLLNRFVEEVPGATHAQAVSSNGSYMAASEDISDDQAEEFAVITAELASLTETAGQIFGLEPVRRQLIETGSGWILIAQITEDACLGIVANQNADLGLIGYEMTVLADKASETLEAEAISS